MISLLQLFGDLDPLSNHYEVENKDDEILIKFTIPGTPKDKITVESFDDKIEVTLDVEPKRVTRIPLRSTRFTLGEIKAEYKLGVLTIKIKKEKIKGTKVDLV